MESNMISILDTTYREGKQSYLGNILPDSLVSYARLLEKLNIKYMEVGYPFTSDVYLREFRKLLKEKKDIKVCVHSALNIINFKKLIDEGVVSIDASIKFNELTEDTVNNKISEIRQISSQTSLLSETLVLRIGIEGAFKLPENLLLSFCNGIVGIKNITRISLSDTDGLATPEMINKTLKNIDNLLPKNIALGLHLHNDCNLANANLYEAYSLFRDDLRELVIDATMGGIGERNGITSIGDIFSLLYFNNMDLLNKSYFAKYYAEIYEYVFKEQTFNRDPLNPTSFSHSSGLHISKFIETGAYQSIDPKMFGYKTKLIFNDFTSGDAIRALLKNRLNIDINKETASSFASVVRNLSAEEKLNFNENQVLQILKDYL